MKKKTLRYLWDAWCIASIVGIWPRFIEPNLITTRHVTVPIRGLPPEWEGARIVQFSDLHLNKTVSDRFLKRLRHKIQKLRPDIITFTGDFLCYGKLKEPERLRSFLSSLEAPCGCYAVYGNHDYSKFVSVNEKGEYDLPEKQVSTFAKGFGRLMSTTTVLGETTERAYQVPLNQELDQIMKQTPFRILHNQTVTTIRNGAPLNIAGLGEYMIGYCLPDTAFKDWDNSTGGIVLSHNPDSVPYLQSYPGDLILCGHTHGSQINLPYLRKKFNLMENPHLARGIVKHNGKTISINRGIGGVMRFRWFAAPELTCITLEKA